MRGGRRSASCACREGEGERETGAVEGMEERKGKGKRQRRAGYTGREGRGLGEEEDGGGGKKGGSIQPLSILSEYIIQQNNWPEIASMATLPTALPCYLH